MITTLVRRLTQTDIDAVAHIHAQAFPRQTHSADWVNCNAQAFPRIRLYVAEIEATICGYALWTEKSGFRNEVVIELEQIAVDPQKQRKGVGEALIRESLLDINNQIEARGATLKAVLVTTRSDNQAQRLYRKALRAEVVAIIPSLFSADETMMIARDPVTWLKKHPS